MTTLQLKLALNCQETLSETIECLSDNISLKTEGAFDVNSLFQILVRAASTGNTRLYRSEYATLNNLSPKALLYEGYSD